MDPLLIRLLRLKEIYTTLVKLKLELTAIRGESNIIAFERKAKVPDSGTLSEESKESLGYNHK